MSLRNNLFGNDVTTHTVSNDCCVKINKKRADDALAPTFTAEIKISAVQISLQGNTFKKFEENIQGFQFDPQTDKCVISVTPYKETFEKCDKLFHQVLPLFNSHFSRITSREIEEMKTRYAHFLASNNLESPHMQLFNKKNASSASHKGGNFAF